ncbi:MAG TPA: hypothetical protein VH120_17145 [Gemmataceae bacterium]|nr:hypothetical protein [Gemmataceae bacterium]
MNITHLIAAGASGEEVCRMVAGGLLERRDERRRNERGERTFQSGTDGAMSARTCFVLTLAGEAYLGQWDGYPAPARADAVPKLVVPHWDGERSQLWYRDTLVKWYRQPAPSQETILSAFEEDSWTSRIDDPLPMVDGLDPQERLHEAVKGLNRGQAVRLLEFHRDGKGEGVTWQSRSGT